MKRGLPGIILFSLSLFFVSPPGWAQGTDVSGSKDHPLISRYDGSVILGQAIINGLF